MPPRKTSSPKRGCAKIITEPQEASTPQPPPSSLHVPFSCAECERVYQAEGPKAWISIGCARCNMPVYFNTLKARSEYLRVKLETQEEVESDASDDLT